ncbi:MAG: gamma-glutamyltransferase [Alphaproteobacteria bacterium]|nr:gamma-glutamyltransferase [Alphaproteobacteria bacterium]
MNNLGWRTRAGSVFDCEKQPATGSRGMVVTNHPLASSAGAEMLAAGGNAIDAAIAALFALTVVEPMMVGIAGGGMAHIRLADGRHIVIDGLGTAPLGTGPTTYTPDPAAPPGTMNTVGRKNALGPSAVAVPGTLKAWCETLARFGTCSLADVMEPAIRLAGCGFRTSAYLHECADESAADLILDAEIARQFLPDGHAIRPGTLLVQGAYADTLRAIAKEGPGLLYGGALGGMLIEHMERNGGSIAMADLAAYRVIERAPVRSRYRGYEVLGPPPPSSSGVHVTQMLNILEGFDLRSTGFGSAETLHLLAEVLKIAFADRAVTTADPDFVPVSVERLISREYAEERRARLDRNRAQTWGAGIRAGESANTTHITIADGAGNVVTSTQTINNLFGAKFMVPGTGIIPNNYMYLFDPHPGRAQSVAPGKRVTTSMSPLIVLRDDAPKFALGLPGGLRIFGSAMQAVINLIDHGMSLQEAVEAPRLWTQGFGVELERGFSEVLGAALAARGHDVIPVPHVAGGMCAIGFGEDGILEGAACWRADGAPIGIGGGPARAGVRFWPDQVRQ